MAVKYHTFYMNAERYLTYKAKLNAPELLDITGFTPTYQVFMETENGDDVPVGFKAVDVAGKKFYAIPPATSWSAWSENR